MCMGKYEPGETRSPTGEEAIETVFAANVQNKEG